MSQIIWSKALIPDENVPIRDYTSKFYGNKIFVEKTKTLPIIEMQAGLPDRRVYRSISRAAVLLSLVCLKIKQEVITFLEKSQFSVGIYCAVENGPVDFESTKSMVNVTKDAFGKMYKLHRNPKMYLRQLPNLAAAQMGIFLGILGPMNVYNSSTYGSLHALEQAEMDLIDNRVKVALICSAFSFENPLIMERIKRTILKGRILCEGAGAILLVSNGSETDWKNPDYLNTKEFFGISHQIILQILKRSTDDAY
ncbi:MAG: hypothetical protein JRI43_04225 [Deltaproteobacteria bacterium]|nr:hypothetical protein [Deltaproteobacteria bacterium]